MVLMMEARTCAPTCCATYLPYISLSHLRAHVLRYISPLHLRYISAISPLDLTLVSSRRASVSSTIASLRPGSIASSSRAI